MDDNAYSGPARLTSGNSEYNELDFLVRQILGKTATAMLVLVKAVNGDRLDVQPMIAQIDGQGNATPHGIIHDIPFVRMQGGTNAIIIDPVAGDIGVAVFASHDISSAKANKAPSNPGSRRRFDWADGIYIGGLLNGTPGRTISFADDGITITPAGTATVSGPTTINGATSITGETDITGNTNITGNADVTGPLAVTGPTTIGGSLIVAGNASAANLSGTNTGDQTSVSGNAGTATKLATARNIAMTGDMSWSVSFDGSANASGAGTLTTVNSSPGTFGSASRSLTATVDAKGRITALSDQAIAMAWAAITGKPTTIGGYGITDAQGLNANLTAISGLVITADQMIYWTGAGAAALVSVPAAARTALSTLSGTNTGDQTNITGNAGTATALATGRTISITGDISYTSPVFDGSSNVTAAGTIAAGAVTLAKMANLAANSILGNNTGSPATPIALTAAQVSSMLSLTSAATTAIGTSGATIPLLSTANTWTLSQTFSASILASAGMDLRPTNPNTYTITFSGTTITVLSQGAIVLAIGANNTVLANATSVSFRSGSTIIGTISSTGFAVTGTSTATGAITSSSPTGGVGYATGAGGTVTQATSKSTGVTLNKVCGQITMNASALAAGAAVMFTLTNSTIAATDVVRVVIASGATSLAYIVQVEATAAGSCNIAVRNMSGGSLSEPIVLNFAVVKATNS